MIKKLDILCCNTYKLKQNVILYSFITVEFDLLTLSTICKLKNSTLGEISEIFKLHIPIIFENICETIKERKLKASHPDENFLVHFYPYLIINFFMPAYILIILHSNHSL